MSKNEFISYCTKLKLTCRYDGNKKTMYAKGVDAAKKLKHLVVKGFKIVAQE
jgi:hypothetical protein